MKRFVFINTLATLLAGTAFFLLLDMAGALLYEITFFFKIDDFLGQVDGTGYLVPSLAGAVSGLVAGCLLSIPYYFLLRKLVSWYKQWIVYTLLGWSLGGFTLLLLSSVLVSSATNILLALLICLVTSFSLIGFMQWIVLRDKVKYSYVWILATSLSWCFGLLVSWSIWSNFLSTYEVLRFLGYLVFVGPATAVIAGITLGYILHTFVTRNRKSGHSSAYT